MRSIFQSIIYWRMATIRALVYMMIVGGGTFLSMTENYTGEEWAALSRFETGRIYATAAMAALGTVLAFLDKTMAQLTEEEKTKP